MGTDRFVVPTAGKIIHTKVDKTIILCYVVNKGYIETCSLERYRELECSLKSIKGVYFVSSINKVKQKSGVVKYRRRLYIEDLSIFINFCSLQGIRFELGNGFALRLDTLANCTSEIKFLYSYASNQKESLESWLTNTFKLRLYEYFSYINYNLHNINEETVESILSGKLAYLNRAPFLALASKTGNPFLPEVTYVSSDPRRYNITNSFKSIDHGCSVRCFKVDKKKGVFKL